TDTIELWSPSQRTAFAATTAERWLPAYTTFCAAEDWGDAAGARRALDAVSAHLGGSTLAAADVDRYVRHLADATPHLDDLDAADALAAALLVSEAVSSCRAADNRTAVTQASMSGFQAAYPDWDLDPDEQPQVWKKSVIR